MAQMAEETQESTVLSGMLRWDMPEAYTVDHARFISEYPPGRTEQENGLWRG
jgi:hypothetical protein